MADDLQRITQAALLKVPVALKRGIDGNKLKVVESPTGTVGYHKNAIAGVDTTDPNTIHVFDKARFLAAPDVTLAHELTHRLIHNSAPTQLNLKPINPDDPYSYDEAKVGQPLNNFSEEQIANMIGSRQVGMNQPGAQYQKDIAARYQPVLDQLQALQPATINTSQPSADNQINTAPNAPQGMLYDAITPTPPPAVVPPSGSQSQPNDWQVEEPNDWQTEPAQTTQQLNQANLREGLKGAGKEFASTLLGTNPVTGSLMQFNTHMKPIEDMKESLKSSNPEQTAGKVAGFGLETLAGGGVPDTVETLINKAKGILSDPVITEGMHNSLRTIAQKAAADAGVEVPASTSIREPFRATAAAIRDKAQGVMDQISHTFSGLTGETGDVDQAGMIGNYDQIGKDIQKTQAKVDSLIGPQNMEKRAAALKQLSQLKANKTLADSMLDRQGLKGARETADRLFKQANDLESISKSLNKHTTGLSPSLLKTGVTGTPERVNGSKLGTELEQHYANGTLTNGLGSEQRAHEMLNAVNSGGRMQRRATAIKAGVVALPIGGYVAHKIGAVTGAIDALSGLIP